MHLRLLLLSILFLFVLSTSITAPLYAQEATEESTTEESADEEDPQEEESIIKQRINDLKERLATRVAELQTINKRSFFGVLTEKTDTKFTLTHKEAAQPVATDTETQFYTKSIGEDKEETDLESLDPGQSIVVFGTLDIDQKTVIAQTIIAQELVTTLYGTVSDIDATDGTFTVQSDESTVLDYEIDTDCVVYTAEEEFDTCGLSKLEVDDTVIVRVEPDDQTLNKGKALRILLLPQSILTSPTATLSPTVEPTEDSTEVTP